MCLAIFAGEPHGAQPTRTIGTMPPRAPLLLALCLSAMALLLAGCGDDPAPAPAEPTKGTTGAGTGILQTPRPDDPREALTWVRAAYLPEGDAELRRRLWAWPLDAAAWTDAEETQVVLTWRIRVALQDGAIERAVEQWKLLLRYFDGHGVTPEGRGLTPEMIRQGLIEEAALVTRRRIEGANPKPLAATSAWKAGADLLRPEDDEGGQQLERARRWAEWNELERWFDRLSWTPGPALGGEHAVDGVGRPFVLLVADDYALGEELLTSVIERWMREGKEAGLLAFLVPVFDGTVRAGLRRVPEHNKEVEWEVLQERAAASGLQIAIAPTEHLEAPLPPHDPKLVKGRLIIEINERLHHTSIIHGPGKTLANAMGLADRESAVLIVDARGRIVGRLSGQGLDPRVLDPVIQKLVSR